MDVLHAKDDAHAAGAESLAHAILAVDDVVRPRDESMVQFVVVHTIADVTQKRESARELSRSPATMIARRLTSLPGWFRLCVSRGEGPT